MKLREKCGIFGIYSPEEPVFPYLYWGMLAQNYRGHQSHGFATFNDGLEYYTELGLIPPIKEPGQESKVNTPYNIVFLSSSIHSQRGKTCGTPKSKVSQQKPPLLWVA